MTLEPYQESSDPEPKCKGKFKAERIQFGENNTYEKIEFELGEDNPFEDEAKAIFKAQMLLMAQHLRSMNKNLFKGLNGKNGNQE